LPDRIPLRPVVAGELPTDAPSLERADGLLETEEAAAEKQAVKRALTVAVNDLTDEDRLVVRMRFVHEMSVADIARALAVPQKPLYRQLERALSRLRRTLEQKGVSRDYVRSLTMG
jgi:RNA polymerase sigma factor (sigma-70 family)